MKTLKLAAIAAFISLSSLATHAIAHGDAEHAKRAGPVRKEQKPWGIAGDAKAVGRRIEIHMSDNMRFTPDMVSVKQGETVRLVHKNDGKLLHEFVLGTRKDLDEHAAVMAKFPDMEHDEPYMAHVGPGRTGEIIWTFNRVGEFDFACLIPGHYQAGMVGKVMVASAGGHRDDTPAINATDKTSVARVAQAEAGATSEGEVRKIDKENKKITLKHGEIKHLGMPGMTMVFQVKDKALLDKVQPGDKLRFTAEKVDGAFVVTSIESAK